MLTLTCYVGLLRPFLRFPSPLQLSNRTITDYFTLGSMDAQGNPGINLLMDEITRLNNSIIPSDRPTNAFYLQNALSHLTRNSPSNKKIRNIGLIIADRYEGRPTALGLMFDWGFNPPGVTPAGEFHTAVPREGCAIFLDAIKDIRSTIGSFEKEIVFTAIHELGHVFNLGHINDEKNFMSTSNNEDVYPPTVYNFRREHRMLLNRAEEDLNVRPGGSIFTGHGFNSPSKTNPLKAKTSPTNLQLEISMSQDEFWYFEPVELDVELSLKNKRVKPEVVPDELDPGYETFLIYITRPDGTVFKYRSPRIYCQNPATIEISTSKPFRRDISIFGQSGGYTFQEIGEHSIQCFFLLNQNEVITSNVLHVNIKASLWDNNKFIRLEKLFTSREVALMLYHRSGYITEPVIEELEEQTNRNKKEPLAINTSYAIARYALHKSAKPTAKEIKKATHHLNFSLDSGLLSTNREKNLLQCKQIFSI
jgi:uncharacterized protein YneR